MSADSRLFFELSVFNEFRASHSLAGFETPHFHLFKVAATFRVPFPLSGDRVLDLVFLQRVLDCSLHPIQNRYLNEALPFSPTSENLCVWLREELVRQLPDAPLHSVSVELADLEGRAMGKAILGP